MQYFISLGHAILFLLLQPYWRGDSGLLPSVPCSNLKNRNIYHIGSLVSLFSGFRPCLGTATVNISTERYVQLSVRRQCSKKQQNLTTKCRLFTCAGHAVPFFKGSNALYSRGRFVIFYPRPSPPLPNQATTCFLGKASVLGSLNANESTGCTLRAHKNHLCFT